MTEEYKSSIYTDYHGKVLGYIFHKINDMTNAEDLCSDVFVKVYEKLDTFDESKSSLSTWIYTITRNTLTDYFRTRKVNGEIPETLSDTSSPEDEICSAEMLEILAKALEKLDDRARDIIVMRYYSGKTLTEISERMNISYSYVKVLHNKALAELKKSF